MTIGVVVIRTFGDGEAAPRVRHTLELSSPPGRGQMLAFPDTAEPVYVDRVIQRPMDPGAWQPGFRRPSVDVVMAAEPATGLQAALAAGWTTA